MSIAKLVARLGEQQAFLEHKWMSRARIPGVSVQQMLARRVAGEPLQYILGASDVPFGLLTIKVRAPVLIPRSETEDWALRLAKVLGSSPARQLSVLDLGTGTGCIPLLLCQMLKAGSVQAYGVDISSDAIKLASENAALAKFLFSVSSGGPSRNTFCPVHASFIDPPFPHEHPRMAPPFDVITSNPPYISWSEYTELPPSVKDWEDPRALFGGPDGLSFYHAIAALAAREGFLNPGAVVAVEVGEKQAEHVQNIFHSTANLESEIWLDTSKKKRTVVARTPS
ncbi:S-adenosyl-L-methionine-dependent methyltransferase [Mycena polygramma]|nr:S-adenosyl-L-methionine-dependent methyltransferase [Mycena polygramma]